MKKNISAAPLPRFLPNAKKGTIDEKGFVICYSDQCPFAYYWAARLETTAAQYGIPLKTVYIGTREDARAMCVPFTNYALFRDGEFITHAIQSDKKLLKLAGISK